MPAQGDKLCCDTKLSVFLGEKETLSLTQYVILPQSSTIGQDQPLELCSQVTCRRVAYALQINMNPKAQ